MHVAEVDVGCGICPVAGIDDREPHSLHIVGNLRVFHMLAFDKGCSTTILNSPSAVRPNPRTFKRVSGKYAL